MKRQVFYSFCFADDFWRTQQVRNIGAIEGNAPTSANQWETVKRQGDAAIKKWIDDNMKNRSCVVVLIGTNTADRKWVKYEIKRAWETEKGIVGIYIDRLKNQDGKQSLKGDNPFDKFFIDKTSNYITEGDTAADRDKKRLSSVCQAYSPLYIASANAYKDIAEKLPDLVEDAINIRNQYPK